MRWVLSAIGGVLLLAVVVVFVVWVSSFNDRDEQVIFSYRSSTSETVGSGTASAGVLSDTPPTTSTPTPEPTPEPAFSIWVANIGGDAELDTCTGGFTHLVGFTTTNSVPQTMLASHNFCGGDVVLAMFLGDVVSVDGDLFSVVEVRDVPKELTPADIQGFAGTVLLQTCYYNSDQMKLVALEPVV